MHCCEVIKKVKQGIFKSKYKQLFLADFLPHFSVFPPWQTIYLKLNCTLRKFTMSKITQNTMTQLLEILSTLTEAPGGPVRNRKKEKTLNALDKEIHVSSPPTTDQTPDEGRKLLHYIHGDYSQQHQKAHVAEVHSDFDSMKQREILLLFLNKCKSTTGHS